MMSNFLITLVGLGSVAYLLKSDVRHGGAMLRRNMKTIRSWLEEEGATAAKPGCVLARALAPHRAGRLSRLTRRLFMARARNRVAKPLDAPAPASGKKPDAHGPTA